MDEWSDERVYDKEQISKRSIVVAVTVAAMKEKRVRWFEHVT